MSINNAITKDNSFLLKVILDKLSIYPDLEVKFHGYNGVEFLEKLEQIPNVNLILMDIEMPKMNGIETVKKVT